MVDEFGGRVRFVVDDLGASEIAKRFGVTRYPALFVGEVLVAKPKDFGFYGRGEGAGDGRYTPFQTAESHARLQADLRKSIASALAGEKGAGATSVDVDVLLRLPDVELRDLSGRPVARTELEGKIVVVEFWATWCPPCRRTLKALEPLARELGDQLVVLALAVESDEADAREVALSHPSLRFAFATPEVARAFGDVTSLPALHVFARDGRRLSSHFGAPPGGDERLEREIRAALAPPPTK